MKHKILLSIFTLLFAASAFAGTIDLSQVTPDEESIIQVHTGDVLTGGLDGESRPYKVLIDENATVTLYNATIEGVYEKNYPWAGITCKGNCEIVLAENTVNTVKGFYQSSGIYVPENKTLTISGSGSLNALGAYGAGIGAGYKTNCGNIVIRGGTIVAEGGFRSSGIGGADEASAGSVTIYGGNISANGDSFGAGIGSGSYGTVGDITIAGGTIRAMGSSSAAGIGGGSNGTIGSIVITDGVTEVYARSGYSPISSVGKGGDGKRTGTITICSFEVDDITTYPWTFSKDTYTVAFDANGGSGIMAEQTLYSNIEIPLNANTFTREGLHFAGWNTKADGSGERFADQSRVLNLAKVGETITLYAQWLDAEIVSLAGLTKPYVAQNGEVLMGKLGGNYKISIADGATVTFDGVTIDGVRDSKYNWAGVTCLGDCNIILADNSVNTVDGFYDGYSGVSVPKNNTLTISGSGSLDAKGEFYAAGIGCSRNNDCGNIVIDGGTITATGGAYAAGIGGGYYTSVGNITITDNVTKVTAKRGGDAPFSIGIGLHGSRKGTIMIGSLESDDISASPFTYTGSAYSIVFVANDGSLRTQKQVAYYDYEQRLNANTFTREGFNFVGWNTKADGSGTLYANRAKVKNLTEAGSSITLYAQWSNDGRIYLSGLADDYVAQDGDVLTGVLEGSVNPYMISIAKGATVTLDGVIINGVDDDECEWAGITCYYDCNIVLAPKSVNTVKGFYKRYPGIQVWPGITLTISGTGSLEASSNGEASGIGGAWRENCGNIVIDGGTITAIGGEHSAGIGGGHNASVGSITITDNVAKVTAISQNDNYSVGKGGSGTRTGDITIGTEVRDDIKESPFVHLRLLTVTAKNKTIAYGDEPADDGVEYAGFLSGDDASVLGGNLMFSTDYKQYGNVGEYDITPYGLTSDNYNIVYKSGTLTVEPKKTSFAAVHVYEDENGKRAEINGEYNGMDAVAIDKKITDVTVAFNREFLKDTYSTMVLPFSVKTEKISGLNAVLYYNGIGKDANNNDAIRMKVLWAKDGVIKDDKGNSVSYKDTVMNANTPYLVLMGSETFEVDGPVTIVPTTDAVTKYDNLEWEFHGVWEYKKWEEGNKELGYAYGFAASAPKDSKIKVGDFVKIGEGTYIYPLRAYLVSSNIPETTTPTQGIRANGAYAKRPTVAQKELPELMSVIVDGLGDNGNGTTVIGQFNTRTGEFKMNYDRGKFDLKGRRVNGTNNARGAYYGKKTTARHPER